MTSAKNPIKIYARLKPTSEKALCKYEMDKHINDDGSTDDILILNTGQQNVDDYFGSPVSFNRPESYKFRFSKVFKGDSPQEEIFREICQPVLESALQGYNSTIFAYGQTGSGKTYTMTGSRQQWKNRGIIPRSLSYIFEKFDCLTDQGYIASAFLSYLEIYNESGYDLLHSSFSSGRIEDLKKVQLLEDSQQQIHMRNLTVHPIKSEDEAMQLLYLGDHNRIIAETPMNEASTRSHCIFTIHINIREGNSSTVRRSKVHLVDLAGSERLTNSTSTGQLFHEARHINLALHYLEQVIVALGEANRSHIPYRNSMMTSILRDSLGGNCMTTMLATLSLENKNLMETLSTCRFSQRVALVTNAAILNEETDPMLLIAQLKTENKRLKEIIANSSIKGVDVNSGALSQEDVAECWKLVERFMTDVDEEAILPVAPDMRMVQTCFRCLKMATQMNKEDLEGISPGLTATMFQRDTSETTLPTFEKNAKIYSETMSREELLECLRIRDAEIGVLKKLIQPPKEKEKKMESSSPSKEEITTIHSEKSRLLDPSPSDEEEVAASLHDFTNTLLKSESTQKLPYQRPFEQPEEPRKLTPFFDTVKKSEPEVKSVSLPIDKSNPLPIDKSNSLPIDKSNFLPIDKSNSLPIDSDSIFLEGLSDSKKEALDSYVRSYKGREKLENVRDNLLTKKNEVESIETLLRRNHANLNNLKVVMMNSEGGGEEDDQFMREAVESQRQSIQKQERQLQQSKEEMRQIEESLKGLYANLMSDFEKHFIAMKEFRGKMGIPSEINFLEIEDPEDTKAEKAKAGSRPVTEMVKEMSGAPQKSTRKARSKKSTTDEKAINSPKKRTSSSSKGKRAPVNTPRILSRDGRSPGKNQAPIISKKTKVPPSARKSKLQQLPTSTSTVPIQLIHRHPDFDSENSTLNLIESDLEGQHKTMQHHDGGGGFANDKEDEELLKELPMTGDATIDQEILSFFKTRQAVFRRINSDRSQRFGIGSVESESVSNNNDLNNNNHSGANDANSKLGVSQ